MTKQPDQSKPQQEAAIAGLGVIAGQQANPQSGARGIASGALPDVTGPRSITSARSPWARQGWAPTRLVSHLAAPGCRDNPQTISHLVGGVRTMPIRDAHLLTW